MGSMQHQIEILDNILENLECDMCNELMSPPMHMCLYGHSFCYDCVNALQSCQKCGAGKSSARNYRLENIYNKIFIPCKNRIWGCTLETKGAEMNDHYDMCPYTEIKCPLALLDNCKWRGERQSAITHCKDKHPQNIYSTNSKWLLCPRFSNFGVVQPELERDSYCILFEAHDEIFKCIWDIDFQTGLMRWGTIYCGRNANASEFYFQIVFEDSRTSSYSEEEVLTCPCQSVNQELFEEGCYIQTHVNTITQFCGTDGLNYRVSIHKNEEKNEAGNSNSDSFTELSQNYNNNGANLNNSTVMVDRLESDVPMASSE